jgi:lysophospholipase L1-like esterase
MKIFRRLAVLCACATWLCAPASAQNIIVKPGEKVAFLGDSITYRGAIEPMGYVRLVVTGLAANGVKIEPIYAGVGGHTSIDMLRRVDNDVLSKKPDWITVSCGINDVYRGKDGVSVEDFKKNITGIVDKAQAAGVKVLILTATLMNDTPDAPLNVTSLPYNGFLRALAKERNLLLADVNADMRAFAVVSEEERRKNGPMTMDGVHMATFGNEVMATGVLRAFGLDEAQLDKAREAWKDIPDSTPVNAQVSVTLRQYEKLQKVAAQQNRSLNDLVNEQVKKYLDSLLAARSLTFMNEHLQVVTDETTGQISSVKLFGEELLDASTPCESELWVNGHPLKLRPHIDPHQSGVPPHLKGERFTDHFSGWGLVLARTMGERNYMKHPCFGIQTLIRRELCDATCPSPGPGGPVIEAPLFVDTFSLLNWNWKFWGEDTRMIFPSSHTQGPSDEYGHIGYEHDTPEKCKAFLQNTWRRIYPGVMAIHGGLFYNARTEHWIALTCRRPNVGYILNIENAGRGVGYDFTLHAPFNIGDSLQMPEVKIYYGQTREEMMSWLADYVTFYYEEAPGWVFKTVWGEGLAWTNKPTWSEQAEHWQGQLDKGIYSGIGYSLVTNRPVLSGTTPLGYEPDPNHGTREEFKTMCRRITGKSTPLLIWMSHTGIQPGGADIDDDWFIRGIDGRACASWGSVDGGMSHCNPGHPGYIEYTKKWIRFYMHECGAKGIFFDCLGWTFPPDYTPRSFMRFPGDTNRMAVRFIEEIYACIKECNPEGILLGEGTTLDAPCNVFSIAGNPVRAIDELGPRDFFLQLNEHSSKRIIIDQGGYYFPASGMNTIQATPQHEMRNQFFTKLVREKGGRDAFIHLPGDISLIEDLLFVAQPGEPPPHTERHASSRRVLLPAPWHSASALVEVFDERIIERDADGTFSNLEPGIYRIKMDTRSNSDYPLR